MLWLERRVVGDFVQACEPDRQAAVTTYVDDALNAMPELLRAGLAAESLLLGAGPAVRNAFGQLDHKRLAEQIARWEHSKIGFIRQYVRALHSLVLFADLEMSSGDGLAAKQ